MSNSKTLITHATTGRARFLGYDIYVAQNDSKITTTSKSKKQRSINAKVQLSVPDEVIRRWSTKFLSNNRVVPRSNHMHHSDLEIISIYNAEFQGLVNYYELAYNVSKLYKVKYHYELSLVKTLAHKKEVQG